jgi:hypothetical protein
LPDLNEVGVYICGNFKFQIGKADFLLEGSSYNCDRPFLYYE